MEIAKTLTRIGLLPILLLLFLAIQFPFLEADPHMDIAPTSRDAFTDEGLNTSQVINRVNFGEWGVDECDNLIKTPLFSLWLYPAYEFFGTSTFIGRFWVLASCLFLLYFASRKHPILAWILGIFVCLSLTEFHLFQYIHFTMAELTACFLVLVAMAYALSYSKEQKLRHIIWSSIFLWAAVFVKNQFAYTLILLPVWIISIHALRTEIWTKKFGIGFLVAGTTIGLGALCYYLGWYLPTKETYDYVMGDQASGRFMSFSDFNEIKKQAEEYLFSPYTKWYSFFAIFSLFICLLNFYFSTHKAYRIFSILSITWAVVELHKFAMWYVPARYLSPLLFAWGLFASIQLVWAIKNALDYGLFARFIGGISLAFFVGLVIIQFGFISKLYREREFSIRNINIMLSNIPLDNRPIIGPWAPTLARETGAKVLPVWFNYFNDKDVINNLNPKIIISELDEGDSGEAYLNQGISLSAIADSTTKVHMGRFDLIIYYLP